MAVDVSLAGKLNYVLAEIDAILRGVLKTYNVHEDTELVKRLVRIADEIKGL